jgi:hypothetical protein
MRPFDEKERKRDQKEDFDICFEDFCSVFFYISIFDSMKECGNIYFTLDYVSLVHTNLDETMLVTACHSGFSFHLICCKT